MIIAHHGVNPQIDPSAYIQQSAHIIGDVHIGAESSVWFNAVVRGDVCYIRIGARVNIQDNAVRTNNLDFIPNRLRLDQIEEMTITTSNVVSAAGGGGSRATSCRTSPRPPSSRRRSTATSRRSPVT